MILFYLYTIYQLLGSFGNGIDTVILQIEAIYTHYMTMCTPLPVVKNALTIQYVIVITAISNCIIFPTAL
jgi:hypothetical protein